MESFPIEILQRIFRFFPPKTFYSKLPRLSRQIRNAALGALPGCPGDTIGVSYEVTVMSDIDDRLLSPAQIAKVERFRKFHLIRGPDGTAIWTVFRIHVTLQASDVMIVGGIGKLLGQEIPDLLQKEYIFRRKLTHTRLAPMIIVRVTSRNLSVETGDGLGPEKAVFRLLVDFAREKNVPEFDLGVDVELLGTLPTDLKLKCTSRVIAHGTLSTASSIGALLDVLARFPNAVALEGASSIFFTAPGRENAQYPGITSLNVKLKPQNTIMRSCFFQAPTVFPNLVDLGYISLFRSALKWKRLLNHMKEPFPPMCGIRTFHIMVRIPDFQPEHLSDIDIEVATREVMELLPNLQRLTIKVRDKDYGGGSIKLLGTFFECAMRFAPPTCVIDIDEIELAVLPDYYEHIGLDDFNTRIYDRVLEVSKTDAWPENMRGWDGRDAVRLSNHHPRRMEFISLSDYDYVSINNY